VEKKLESSGVPTSEALLAAALTASARRGVPVARRRIVLRWTAWFVWGWFLPLIGLATLCIALTALVSVEFWGAAKVFDTSQTWLAEQLGLPTTATTAETATNKATASAFDNNLDNHSAAGPSLNATPTVVPQLQIDRNYSSHDQSNPSAPDASAVPNPSYSTKPSGALQ
jgi:hypothetical protein